MSPLSASGLLIVLGANVWLLAAIATEAMFDGRIAADKVDWSPTLSASIRNVATRKPIEAYRQILARPVFFKSRQPFVPVPTPLPSGSIPTPPIEVIDPGLALGGIMIKSDVRRAYVFSKNDANGTWTSEGDDFMGWRVRSISGTGAKLEQKGRSIDLQLYPQVSPSTQPSSTTSRH